MAPTTQGNKVAIITPSADISRQLRLFRKRPFHPIWLLYMEANPPNPKKYPTLQMYSINFVLPNWPSTHSQPNWKDTEKNEVLDRKRKKKMARKRITLSTIDKEDWWLQTSLCVYWQKAACSSRAQLAPVKNEARWVDCLPPQNVFWNTSYLFLV